MHNPQVPETLEGWSLLHLMFRIRWTEWRGLSPATRSEICADAAGPLAAPEDASRGDTAVAQLLGHKGDLMVIAARPDFEELGTFELALSRCRLAEYLEPTTSFVSIVELGMYEMTAKIHRQLGERGLETGSDDFERAFDAAMDEQRGRVRGRLFPAFPRTRYCCFYPMNKRRGESRNWYDVSFDERADMMREHGMIGRGYAGQVTQMISGAIGYDDWEWGVDLFAADPLVFKKLIYEMRFDKASAVFAEFGPFYVGLQFSASELPRLMAGEVPVLVTRPDN